MQVKLKNNTRRLKCSCKSTEVVGQGSPENATYSCAKCGVVLYIRTNGTATYRDQYAEGNK